MNGTSVWGWLTYVASSLLEPRERAAVCGDLIELGVRGPRALAEVLGLVARRQFALWRDWHPWLAVASVALPIGLLLSYTSRWWSNCGALYFVLYVKGWSSAFLASPGARRDVFELVVGAVLSCATLVAWSWTSGYVLGRLSRRTVWVTGAVFCVAVVVGAMGTTTTARPFPHPLGHFYYGVVWPRTLQLGLVLLPALAGMRHGFRLTRLRLRPALMGVLAVALLTLWSAQRLENSLLFGRGRVPPSGPDRIIGTEDDERPLWPLSFVMLWPSIYLLANAGSSRAKQGPALPAP